MLCYAESWASLKAKKYKKRKEFLGGLLSAIIIVALIFIVPNVLVRLGALIN